VNLLEVNGLDWCRSASVLICVVIQAATRNHVSELIFASCAGIQFFASSAFEFGRQ